MSQKQLNFLEPITDQLKPPNGNRRLVTGGGILTDQSDYRIHVSGVTQHLYLFSTQAGREAFLEEERKGTPLKRGGQPGVEGDTFEGHPIAMSAIGDIQSFLIPLDIWNRFRVARGDGTSNKGRAAVGIAYEMILRKVLTLPMIDATMVEEKAIQVNGNDIIVKGELKISVKYDHLAGEKKHGGSGKIFLQKRECNPRGLI